MGGKLLYYLALFGDLCVPVYCFCSGYAQDVLAQQEGAAYRRASLHRLGKFLIHFWIILIVFSIVGLAADASGEIPGSWTKFIGNFFLYGLSYNGAWWFVLTYALLICATPALRRAVYGINPWLCMLLSGCIYFAAYVFRFVYTLPLRSAVLDWLWNQALLFGTSQFSFVLGMLGCRFAVVDVTRRWLNGRRLRRLVICAAPCLMFALHCVEPSLILAPITGLTTLLCFHLWDKPRWAERLFSFFGRHSMNIWLTHMFFYLVLFPGLVFQAKYPALIFAWMLGLCVAVSYAVDALEKALYWAFRLGKRKLILNRG